MSGPVVNQQVISTTKSRNEMDQEDLLLRQPGMGDRRSRDQDWVKGFQVLSSKILFFQAVYFLEFTYFLRTFVIFNPFKEERNSGQDIRIASCTTPNVEGHKSYQSIFSILITNDQWSPTVSLTSIFSWLKSANHVVFDNFFVYCIFHSVLALFVRHRPQCDLLQDVRKMS